jgi:hypothetical protein
VRQLVVLLPFTIFAVVTTSRCRKCTSSSGGLAYLVGVIVRKRRRLSCCVESVDHTDWHDVELGLKGRKAPDPPPLACSFVTNQIAMA